MNVIIQWLANALAALGRAVKTIYILRYIHDEQLRSRVQLQVNRGESRHDLDRRCLFFANRGEFRTGDLEEIINKARCLSLLSSAVVVWNAIQVGQIVSRLRAGGEEVLDTDLTHISPLSVQVTAWILQPFGPSRVAPFLDARSTRKVVSSCLPRNLFARLAGSCFRSTNSSAVWN